MAAAVPTVFYLTHPQVRIDPAVPVPDWGLSDAGRAPAEVAAAATWLAGVTRIVSSGERKAGETAGIVAARIGAPVEIREAMHENDRSATGFLPPAEFELVADAFFAEPMQSVRGWETAAAAQARIVGEVEACLAVPDRGDLLLVGHGAVGTLLLCHLLGEPISRTRDQRGGGGCVFAFDRSSRRVIHAYRPLEAPDIGRA
jgi:broad specificity phosphatase PhoE